MKNQRKPLSSKKPPAACDSHDTITDWIQNNTMPKMQPLVTEIDALIIKNIPNLKFAIKWGKIFYGTEEQGWIIEVGAFAVSVNIVFLNGAAFSSKPPLGTDEQSRYIKLRTIEEVNQQKIIDYIEQAKQLNGWK